MIEIVIIKSKKREETKFVGDYILTAGAIVATLFLLLAMLLNSALF
jgi:tRNA G37 N-methylase TrmD